MMTAMRYRKAVLAVMVDFFAHRLKPLARLPVLLLFRRLAVRLRFTV